MPAPSPDAVNRARQAVEKVLNAFSIHEATTDAARAGIQAALSTAGMPYTPQFVRDRLADLRDGRLDKLGVLATLGFPV